MRTKAGAPRLVRREMNMKTKALAITLVLLADIARLFAVFVAPFNSWDDLTRKSPDIVIARWTTTADPFLPGDAMIRSDIEVTSVLKGNTKASAARMVSQYWWPRQGEQFLMFSTYHSDERLYNATESYRVIPLGRYFSTNQLTGKSLDEQIQLVLRCRLDELTGELKKGADEKKRLEEGLKK
jgi:hypothetical protein